MRKLSVSLSSFVMLLSLVADPAHAQHASGGLAGLLSNLILRDIVTPSNEGGAPGSVLIHDAHFSPFNRLYLGALHQETGIPEVATVANFNRALATEIATFPLGSSSGGFTFEFDVSTGAFSRASSSFGPAFAERSRTMGRNRFNLGMSYRHSGYDTFEGLDLEGGAINFYLPHNDCCPGQTPDGAAVGDGQLGPPPAAVGFEGDLVQVGLNMKARTDTTSFFFSYGLTNRWDVGVAVPLVHVDLDAVADAEILRLSTADRPLVHSFELGNPNATQKQFSSSGSATGIGDVLVRSKFNFAQGATAGLAAAIDLRLPTGDADNLLGTGTTQAKVYLVGSTGWDRFAQHFNIGYTFSGEGDLAPLLGDGAEFASSAFGTGARAITDEFNYTAGVEFVAHPRLTIVGDLLGRTLRDAGRLSMVEKSFEFVTQGTVSPVQTARFNELALQSGNLNLLVGTIGMKANVANALLLSVHVLGPFTDAGLKDSLSWMFALDYSF